jgi:coenzyme F420-dependent glucose-6-phosphate dehydrogenase
MTKFAWMCATEAFGAEALLEQARTAEEVGFDAIVVPDAFNPWTAEGSSTFTWSWLGAAANATRRIELITTVTAPMLRYHPAVIAQAAATIDQLSGGRFVLGLGTGHPLHDASLGFGVVGPRVRSEMLAESVEIIRRLLMGERVSHAGKHFSIDGVRLASPAPRVRVWLAASGPRAATLAGHWGDGVITSVKTVEDARRRVIEPFLQAAHQPAFDRAGDPSILLTRWAVIGRDDAEAWRSLGSMRGLRVVSRDISTDPAQLGALADEAGPERILADFARANDPASAFPLYAEIVGELTPSYVSIQLASADPIAALRSFAEGALPRLRSVTHGSSI